MRYLILLSVFLVTVSCQSKKELKKQPKPNIIYIYPDQLSETMMSSAGNPYLKTPAMDYIAHTH